MAGMRLRRQLTAGVTDMRSGSELMEHLPVATESTPASGGAGASLTAATASPRKYLEWRTARLWLFDGEICSVG